MARTYRRHPYRVREIAQQSGLSESTVDRVLHERPGVRAATVAEVHRAIADLDRQAAQVGLVGRTFMVDLVMQAPQRFSSAVRAALEAELPALRPAVLRCRFHLREEGDPAEVVRTLRRVRERGSQGVLLKAPDAPEVIEEVAALVEAGIPVITLVTDLPLSRRHAYVGIDNRAAGATAAYLLDQWRCEGDVLVTLSSSSFRGEEQREAGFRHAWRRLTTGRSVHEVTETAGLDERMRQQVADVLAAHPAIDAVYSIGGGNTAVVEAFDAAHRPLRAFVAHDLDDDNTALLRTRRVSVVLHHDLRADLRRACRAVMQANGALPGRAATTPSQIQVVTPCNEPAGLGRW
jgi:LacI family transcriptional regulator